MIHCVFVEVVGRAQNNGFSTGGECMGDFNINPKIDLHSHILPQMDDGSESSAMSVQLLRQLVDQGVRLVCATSHFYIRRESIDCFLQRRREAVTALGDALDKADLLEIPTVRLGAEVAYFPGITQYQGVDQLCLGGTRTLLLELSYTQWTPQQVDEVASLSLDHGYQVILAHPERFSHMRSYWSDMERMLSLPIALQINADSLLHWRSRKLALELLESTLSPLLSSDCHNLTTRPPRLEKARQVVRKKLGVEMLARIDETAQHLVQPPSK